MNSSLSSQPQRSAAPTRQREVRLDFFRGLALIFIFLDHIPSNAMNWLTIRNFGFSDASEQFVFISGYAAVLAYSRRLSTQGFIYTAARIYKRCWQLYVAQLLVFMVITAQIAYIAATFNNPMYSEEMKVVNFIEAPHITLLEALLLKFRLTNMDILPLYIVLLMAFPVILLGLHHCRSCVVAASAALYVAANIFGWNLPTWPTGTWVFNPFTWQFLFVLGALAGLVHGRRWLSPLRTVGVPAAVLYLAFALFVVMTWHIPSLAVFLPDWLQTAMYPIDKANLDPLRLTHFLALAYLTILAVPEHSPLLRLAVARPLIRCGEHSLEIFCLGIFLSFAAHMMLVELSSTLAAQAMVSMAGIAVMIGVAYYLAWYRRVERETRAAPGPIQPTREGTG